MDMEKYSRLIEDFASAKCNVKEDDIMKKVDCTKKRHLRTIVGIAACVTLIFIGTTVSAATGLIDLTGLFKKLFNDEVTSELIEEGAVQEVNLTAENDKYTLTFEGITGDSGTQFGVFKLVDNAGDLGNPSLLQVDVKIVGMSVVEEGRLSEYGSCFNKGFTASDEDENTYYIKVNLPSYWIYDSQEDIYISLNKVTAYYGEIKYFHNSTYVEKADKVVEIPFGLECTFTPDRSVLPKSTEFEIGEIISSEHGEFTVKTLDASRYETRLVITFPTNENIIDINDATALWHRFDNDYSYEYECDIEPGETWPMVEDDYRLINFTDKQEFGKRLFKTVEDPSIYTEGEVKLFVDGVEIKRTVTTSYRWASAMDSTENPAVWGNVIIFEAFDVSTAETIEVRYKDQTIKVK